MTHSTSKIEPLATQTLTLTIADLKLNANPQCSFSAWNWLCVIGGTHIIMSESVQHNIGLISGVTASSIKRIMIERYHQQVRASASFTEPSAPYVMISSFSSLYIPADASITGTNGDHFHQDGRGLPVSTRITLLDNYRWQQGGALHIVPATLENKEALYGKPAAAAKDRSDLQTVFLKESGDTVTFANRDILHAVDGKLVGGAYDCHRTIVMDRLNEVAGFNWALIQDYFGLILKIPRPLSLQLVYLSAVLTPRKLPARKKTLEKRAQAVTPSATSTKIDATKAKAAPPKVDDLELEEETFAQRVLTPDLEYRQKLENKHGPVFTNIARQLVEDGALLLPSFFSSSNMEALLAKIQALLANHQIDPLLGISSHSGAAHQNAIFTEDLAEIAGNPALVLLMSYYFGCEIELADWRCYFQAAHDPMNLRAWGGDFHCDMNPGEIKAMVLPHDVANADGQAMHFITGSQKFWRLRSQAGSKFLPEDAEKQFGSHPILSCHGKAGTTILFDPENLHRGTRGSKPRFVITFNFVPKKEETPKFPLKLTAGSSERLSRAHDPATKVNWDEIATAGNKHYMTFGDPRVQRHNQAPCFERTKPRYDNTDSFVGFMTKHASMDMMPDLDLPKHLGPKDIPRDVIRVRLRERDKDDDYLKRLRQRVVIILTQAHVLLNVEQILTLCKAAYQAAQLQQDLLTNDDIINCFALLNSLQEALTYCDSRQRFRSNLIYLYSLFDYLHELSGNNTFQDFAERLLASYTSYVQFDDNDYLHHKQQNPDSFTFFSFYTSQQVHYEEKKETSGKERSAMVL